MNKNKYYSTDKQEVFEEARRILRVYLNLELSLAQQLELKNIWVIEMIREYKHINLNKELQFSTVSEAAARFMWNNFAIDKKSVRRYLYGVYINPRKYDPPLARYIEIQQDRMHLL